MGQPIEVCKLENEVSELENKRNLLNAFLRDSRNENMDTIMRGLMCQQQHHMEAYLRILGQRLDLMTRAEPASVESPHADRDKAPARPTD